MTARTHPLVTANMGKEETEVTYAFLGKVLRHGPAVAFASFGDDDAAEAMARKCHAVGLLAEDLSVTSLGRAILGVRDRAGSPGAGGGSGP